MKTNLVLILACLLAVSACDKSSEGKNQGAASAASNNQTATATKFVAERVKDKSSYFIFAKQQNYSSQQVAEEFNQFNRIFWAATPKKYEDMAVDRIPGFAKSNDEFKRSDLIKEHKAELDAFYDEAKSVGTKMAVFTGPVHINKYDAQKKGFEFKFFDPQNVSLGNAKTPYMVVTAAGIPYYYNTSKPMPEFYVHKPATEDDARRIESALAKLRGGSSEASANMIVYGRVVKTEFRPERREVVLLPDHIEVIALKNRQGDDYEVLWEIDAASLQSMWKLHGEVTLAPGPDDVVSMLGLKPVR